MESAVGASSNPASVRAAIAQRKTDRPVVPITFTLRGSDNDDRALFHSMLIEDQPSFARFIDRIHLGCQRLMQQQRK